MYTTFLTKHCKSGETCKTTSIKPRLIDAIKRAVVVFLGSKLAATVTHDSQHHKNIWAPKFKADHQYVISAGCEICLT